VRGAERQHRGRERSHPRLQPFAGRQDRAGRVDANSALAGDQAFSFIGTAAFSSVAGQLRDFRQDGDTFVAGDVNGDGMADFHVVLDPLVSLVSSDFLL
jgi:hypothetical protein